MEFECGDIRDAEALTRIVQDFRPEQIYHLAAFSSPAESFRRPLLTYEVNFSGTLNLLEACRRARLESRILVVSSAGVYGHASEASKPLSEDSPLQPRSPYAASKAAAEMLALDFFSREGLGIIRVRPFNHTGPRQTADYVCSGLARQASEIELGLRPPEISAGNLHARRDFSDVRDIVRGYALLLDRGEPGEVYNLCAGRAVSIGEIAQTIANLSSRPISIVPDPSKMRQKDPPLRVGDCSKAREKTGWEPRTSLEQTLRDLKQWWVKALSARAGGEPADSI